MGVLRNFLKKRSRNRKGGITEEGKLVLSKALKLGMTQPIVHEFPETCDPITFYFVKKTHFLILAGSAYLVSNYSHSKGTLIRLY